ncbi:hypothetical protein LTR36_005830 [Oleoguttula mirabilis]|uniref:Glucose-methanol-choline oxidoreductase N-terminal domain-containing protein n=1 Tax=Oleoguttula mirabilis TaxID=1507867 RepID=A0AAV9JCS1_9PEZI|nr:hypothetical protein LTR36_005830 [Oleoguttula mirabilis]
MGDSKGAKGVEQTHDIIIIGAGTAGSVLANRLSANPDVSVLVLEAGKDHNNDPNVYTPGLALQLLDNDKYDWRFATEPEPQLNDRVIKHPRGKVVGGSSAINSFALIYPNRAGIDVWESMGCEGWSWDALQPAFEKFQSVCEPVDEMREQLVLAHGEKVIGRTEGPLQASFPPRVEPLQKAWVETWRSLGLDSKSDSLEGEALGGHTSTCHISADRKERSHAGVAFLRPVADRPNLTVVTEALVERIIFSRPPGGEVTATGVQYTRGGNSHTVHARKEVILAAGSFGSPALLELSGIGDRDRLSELGIPVVHHNPAVGENLQDHIRGGLSFEAAEGVPARSRMPEEEARKLYEHDRSGPWGESACWAFAYMPLLPLMSKSEQAEHLRLLDTGFESVPPSSAFEKQRDAFVRTMLSSPTEAAATAYLARKPAILAPSSTPEAGADAQPTNWITLFAMLAHPLSRGSVHITSRSPSHKPRIIGNYYSHPLDLEVHARILKAFERLVSTPPLSKWLKVGGKRMPNLGPDASLEDIKASLRQYAGTNYHPTGTCSMLPEEVGGVVDSRLRVYGVRNLRVIDASVMPMITRGNVIATVYAIAENAAEMLTEELGG